MRAFKNEPPSYRYGVEDRGSWNGIGEMKGNLITIFLEKRSERILNTALILSPMEMAASFMHQIYQSRFMNKGYSKNR
jgi:hypothetical protein